MTVAEQATWLATRLSATCARARLREVLRWVGMSPATYYRHIKGDRSRPGRRGPDPRPVAPVLCQRIVETARVHAALGYKKVHAVLRRDDVAVSRKVVYRVMREERLLKAKKCRRAAREAARLRLRELQPKRPNQLWQMDVTYIHVPRYGFWYQIDVMDYFSRYLLAQRFTWSYSAREGLAAIRQAVTEAERLHGAMSEPVFLLTDNGSTFIAKRFRKGLKKLLTTEGADLLQHLRIGYRMPEHLGLLERFHGTIKQEVVWPNWFADPLEARRALLAYGEYYNYDRPHWALELKTPAEVYMDRSWQDVQPLRSHVLESVA